MPFSNQGSQAVDIADFTVVVAAVPVVVAVPIYSSAVVPVVPVVVVDSCS